MTVRAALVALLLLPAGATAAPSISVTVDGTPGNAGWYRSDVVIHWAVSGETMSSGCDTVTISGDTQGVTRTCTASDGTDTATLSKFVKIDKTPPVVAGATPDRAPDTGAWFTHPVGVSWSGSDGTSGLAGCTATTYSGPDDAAASVSGTCSDKAGNVSAPLATTLAYDATPPSLSDVVATPAEAAVALRWTVSGGAALIRVDRSPGRAGAPSSPVYEGTGDAVTDDGLQGATRYTYTVTAVDAAGNAATATASAVPTGTLLAPAPGATLTKPPLLRWKVIKRARYYNVQIFRGKTKILSTWPTRARLQLRTSWTYRGHKRRLVAGRYRWYVWPGYGPRNRHHYGKLLGRRTFTIP